MDNYIVIKDWFNVKKGTIIASNNGIYSYDMDGDVITFSNDTLNNKEYFELYNSSLTISKIDDIIIDTTEYRFRIQLDVKCTKDKLKEIETFIRSNIEGILK